MKINTNKYWWWCKYQVNCLTRLEALFFVDFPTSITFIHPMKYGLVKQSDLQLELQWIIYWLPCNFTLVTMSRRGWCKGVWWIIIATMQWLVSQFGIEGRFILHVLFCHFNWFTENCCHCNMTLIDAIKGFYQKSLHCL